MTVPPPIRTYEQFGGYLTWEMATLGQVGQSQLEGLHLNNLEFITSSAFLGYCRTLSVCKNRQEDQLVWHVCTSHECVQGGGEQKRREGGSCMWHKILHVLTCVIVKSMNVAL